MGWTFLFKGWDFKKLFKNVNGENGKKIIKII